MLKRIRNRLKLPGLVLIALLTTVLLSGQSLNLHAHAVHADNLADTHQHLINIHTKGTSHELVFDDENHGATGVDLSITGILKYAKLLKLFDLILLTIGLVILAALAGRLIQHYQYKPPHRLLYNFLRPPLRAPPL